MPYMIAVSLEMSDEPKNSAQKTILHDFYPKPAGVNPDCQGRSSDSFPPQRLPSGIASGKECAEPPFRG